MNPRLLHSVIDDLLATVDQRPELAEPVTRFVFDDSKTIREGLCDVRTRAGPDVRHADGSVSFGVCVELLASHDLIQFAHAVSNGVVPHMRLSDNAASI
jgi:hypothetical protein